MSEIDNQDIEAPEATPSEAEAKELSFEDELSQARAEDAPETVESKEPKAEDPAEPKEQEGTETRSPKEGEPEEPKEPEAPKETEAERAQRFYELRQQAKLESTKVVEQKIDQAYQPQPVDELTQHFLDEGYTDFEAAMLAKEEVRNQRELIQESRVQIAELNARIETEAVQVMHEFPVFDPGSSEYDKDFADKASELYVKAANAEIDPRTGAVVRTSMTPYQFYKQLSEIRNAGMSQAQIRAQKAAESQMAAVAPQPSSVQRPDPSHEDKQAASLAAALDNVR